MSNPANAATLDGKVEGDNKTEGQVFEAKINTVVDAVTRDEKGRYIIPDDLSEAEKFAVVVEKRRRDTQSEYTKTKKSNKALQAEKDELLKQVSNNVTVELTKEQAEELEELKFSDPDTWRKKVNSYERDAISKQKKVLDDKLAEISTSSLEKEELERRGDILIEFNQFHPDFELTDEIVANDIPPRITKSLETGKISFEVFLQECYNYVKTGKVVVQTEQPPKKQKNLSKVGGGSKPDDNAVKEDIVQSYEKEIF